MVTETAGAHTLERLAAAAGDLLVHVPRGDVAVTGLAYDSRAVAPGDLFFCIPGTVADGHRFAPDAAARGATALCVERPLGLPLPQVVVSDARRAMARIAAHFFSRPGDALELLGVTGTNGKTTTAFLLESVLVAAGRRPGLIGTVETRIAGERRPGVRTTPESVDLQRLLADMREAGVEAVAMEVTSHALALHRVEGLRFKSAAFTNLSQDHLDFHAGMDDYFAAKRSLFLRDRAEAAAVNVDDPYGRKLKDGAEIPCLGFGLARDADVRGEDVRLRAHGTDLLAVTPVGDVKISTPLIGAFNVSNCLAACAVAVQAGIELEAIEAGVSSVRSVPGRFENVDRGQPFSVVVDYAHTPDSLDNVLRAARHLTAGRGRVICVFGCGGDRDPGKRPLMGTAAARLSDVVVVTSDNPRSEHPPVIIDAILEGVLAVVPEGPDAVLVDREEAIRYAVGVARPGDIVVIAGKGHETGQEFADRVVPFDDREVAARALEQLGWDAS